MSQSQGIEVRRVSRRTIATGAAWAVPVITIGAAAPLVAASQNCVPEFEVVAEGSFKCCNGQVKNMKLKIKVTDISQCLEASDIICIQDVSVATPNDSIGDVVFVGDQCTTEGGTVDVYLLDVSNCSVNLLVTFTINGGVAGTVPLKSGNIPSGNTDNACVPPAP